MTSAALRASLSGLFGRITTSLSPNRSSRNGAKILGSVVHTTESPSGSIDGVVAYLRNPSVEVSSHYVVDDVDRGDGWTRVVCLVPESEKAWTAKSANPYFVQYENVGRASRTRAEWLAHEAQLRTLAAMVAEDSLQYGFPVRHGVPGIVGHGDLNAAGYPNDHTDPGPGFPWDHFLALVAGFLDSGDRPPVEHVTDADFWKWARWWRGHGEFKQYGPRAAAHRPDVPKRVPAAWWGRLKKNIGGKTT